MLFLSLQRNIPVTMAASLSVTSKEGVTELTCIIMWIMTNGIETLENMDMVRWYMLSL